MDTSDERIRAAVENTVILRPPRQSLSSFGITNVYYYLVTEPAYTELVKSPQQETAIREGRVIAERPRIVTPYYLSSLEGFSTNARRYLEIITQAYGPSAPGLFYTYRNEPKELNIVSDNIPAVVEKLNAEIDKKGDPLMSIIKGQDEMWDVSLMKFIYELTRSSVADNLSQMGSRGLLNMDRGIPMDARLRIEEMFSRAARGEAEPRELKAELDRWGIFEDYQDRFFNLFKVRK